MKDQELQNITAKARLSTKGNTYMFLKGCWKIEHYLTSLDASMTRALIKFRTGNHKLPIETGRYKKIPIENRKCRFCNTLGDEFHYVMECKHFYFSRKKYIDKNYYIRPNMEKFKSLMNCESNWQMTRLAIFLSIIMKNIK